MDIELGMPGQIMPPVDGAIKNALRNEADGFDAVWWPDHLMGWFPDSLWTEDLTPLAKSQPNPHVHVDPLMMMGVAGSQMTRAKVGHRGDRPDPPQSVGARPDDGDDRPPDQGPGDPRARFGGEAQHHAVRHAVRQAGRPAVRGHRHPAAALGVRGQAGQLRWPVPPSGERGSGHGALRGEEPADLDGRARAEDAGTHRTEVRRVDPDEDVVGGVCRRSRQDQAELGRRRP